MLILVPVTLFQIYQNPDESPKSISFEQHSNEIVEINEQSKKYQLIDDEQKFNSSKKLMYEKLQEIFLDYLEIKISEVTLLEGQYPFWDVQYRIDRYDLEPSSICSFEQNIPLHMQKISQTDNFQKFTKKYSPHTLELIIMDERDIIPNIHYGLIATNDENQRASTYFHLDSCINEITDEEPYHLSCSDENDDYRFSTFNTDDILSSFSNASFCKIELDSWRQSLFEYSKKLYEKQRQLELQSIASENQVAFGPPFSEMNILGDLRSVVENMVHGKFDDKNTQEMIIQYEKQNGSLPKELLELIENRP